MCKTDRNDERLAELLDAMKKVVNIRKFSEKKVEDYKINLLFEALSYGPSMANQQPWEIVGLDSSQVEKMIHATLDPFFTKGSENGQAWLKNAPYVCVILIDLRRAEARLGQIGKRIAIEDTFSALQNLRLYAQLLGLGTSVVREFDPDRLNEMLDIPKIFLPVSVLVIGYPNETPELPPRFKYHEFLHKGGVNH